MARVNDLVNPQCPLDSTNWSDDQKMQKQMCRSKPSPAPLHNRGLRQQKKGLRQRKRKVEHPQFTASDPMFARNLHLRCLFSLLHPPLQVLSSSSCTRGARGDAPIPRRSTCQRKIRGMHAHGKRPDVHYIVNTALMTLCITIFSEKLPDIVNRL